MPVVHGLEVALLAQLHDHIVVIQAGFDRGGGVIVEELRQMGQEIIALSLLELLGEIVAPKHPPDVEIQLIGEEEIQPLAAGAGHMALKLAVERIRHGLAHTGVHGVEGVGHAGEEDVAVPGPAQRPAVMEVPRQAASLGQKAQHLAGELGVLAEHFIGEALLAGGAEGVVREADGHAAAAGFGLEPLHQVPTLGGEGRGVTLHGQAPGPPAVVAVAVVDLQAADVVRFELVEDPGQLLLRDRVALPPEEGNLAVACGRRFKMCEVHSSILQVVDWRIPSAAIVS